MNSFEGASNEKCEHEVFKGKIMDFDFENVKDKTTFPFLVMIYENREIAEDAFSFLIYYI